MNACLQFFNQWGLVLLFLGVLEHIKIFQKSKGLKPENTSQIDRFQAIYNNVSCQSCYKNLQIDFKISNRFDEWIKIVFYLSLIINLI